jgi:hypothetical protein
MDHAFICYSRRDAAFVLALASGLRKRGRTVWVDTEDIAPGVDWDRAIDAAIDACATFLIVLSPDAVGSSEVRGELRAALNKGKRVLPILYRTCDVPRQLRTTQYLDVTVAGTIAEEALDVLARALQERPAAAATPPPRDPVRDERNRHAVLEDVGREVADRLARSLQTEAPVQILMARQAHQVARPWDGALKAATIPRAAPPVTGILEVYLEEAVAGRLLILGAPGSGKTTASLRLARELIARAEHDPRQPVPVLLSLSSWKNKDAGFDSWLAGELKTKYGIHRDHSMAWLDVGRLALLLDGLDELSPERQEACVRAVNEFLKAYRPQHLVVCSRLAEYETLAVKLQLNGAVRLLPMTEAQVEEYLQRAGHPQLWEEICGDPEAMELARSPLLLGAMASVGESVGNAVWKPTDSPEQRRERLFEAYVRLYMAERPGDVYPGPRAREWLAGLAEMLRRQGRTEFLVERIQPDWLRPGWQRWLYRAGVFLAASVAVATIMEASSRVAQVVPPGAVTSALKTAPGHAEASVLVVAVPLILGAIMAARNTITPIETLTFSWARTSEGAVRWLRKALTAGPRYGLYFGIAIGSWPAFRDLAADLAKTASMPEAAGVQLGVAGGVLAAAALALIKPQMWISASRRPRLRPRLAAVALAGLVPGLLLGVTIDRVLGLFWTLAIAFLVGLGMAWDDRSRIRLLRTLASTTVASMVVAATSRAAAKPETPYITWMGGWMMGGLAAGLVCALVEVFATRLRRRREWVEGHTGGSWVRLLAVSSGAGLVLGLAGVALARAGFADSVRAVAVAGMSLHYRMVVFTISAAWGAVVGVIAALGAAPIIALGGALSGITGPDVARRAVPNQGIRQSAANIALFCALGALMVGLPYGLFNLALGATLAGVRPDAADWWRIGLSPVLVFALLAGLLPGAACIQHYVLRVVLSVSGTVPVRLVRFLDFASHRMLLQRVGGRYLFIHVLLRDHLALRGASAGAR